MKTNPPDGAAERDPLAAFRRIAARCSAQECREILQDCRDKAVRQIYQQRLDQLEARQAEVEHWEQRFSEHDTSPMSANETIESEGSAAQAPEVPRLVRLVVGWTAIAVFCFWLAGLVLIFSPFLLFGWLLIGLVKGFDWIQSRLSAGKRTS